MRSKRLHKASASVARTDETNQPTGVIEMAKAKPKKEDTMKAEIMQPEQTATTSFDRPDPRHQIPERPEGQSDENRFYTLAKIVDDGLDSFVRVGKALMELRDKATYKAIGYKSFEDMCRQCFGMSRDTAYKTISAANLADKMYSIVYIPNEGTARELVSIKDETVQLAVAKRASEMAKGEAISSVEVKAAKAEIIGVKPKAEKVVVKSEPTETAKASGNWPKRPGEVVEAVKNFMVFDKDIVKIAEDNKIDLAQANTEQILFVVFNAYLMKEAK